MATFKSLRSVLTPFGLRQCVHKQIRSVLVPRCRQLATAAGVGGEQIARIHSIPLTEPVPWIPQPQFATLPDHEQETQVTVLENGLRVASQPKFGHFCTVGVLIDSGSRYEVLYPSGISHFLEKLAFKSTSKYASRDVISQKLEELGGICDCQASRDTLIYATSSSIHGLPFVIDLLSEVVLRPQITEEELEDVRQTVSFELETLDLRPDPEPLLVEMIHAAAFRGNTLGLPKICPPENITKVEKSHILTFLNQYHTLDRIVLAGVGVEHELLVELARESFAKKPVWLEDTASAQKPMECDLSVAQYTGGKVEVTKDLSNVSLGPTPMPELAHVVLGLESCSHKDDDFIAFCVLNMLMGGGGSFSAGGPGKGMYTRLYTNVLNRFHWIHNATAYNHSYNDAGVFCVHASADPSSLKDLVEVVVRELVSTQHSLSDEELLRAKTQLQSMLLMNLESRPIVFEDVGRQVLANRHRHTPQYYYELIGKITREDIQRVARRMLRSSPSVAALGNLSKLPSYEDIQTALSSRDGRFPHRLSLFR